MGQKKRHWLWNLLIIVTVIICAFAFTAHYKNWTKVEGDHIRILSGLYYDELKFSAIDSVEMVDRIPQMERVNGFSAFAKEKGVFKDSVHPDKNVRVYVDNLRNPKIRIVHKDSLTLFLNFSDSIRTQEMYQFLLDKMHKESIDEPN